MILISPRLELKVPFRPPSAMKGVDPRTQGPTNISLIVKSLFVCNRGDTKQYNGKLHTRKLSQTPILVFLTPWLTLSSHQHRTLVCLILVRRSKLHIHSPVNPTTARQGCFQPFSSPNYSFSDIYPSLESPRVTKLPAFSKGSDIV